MPTFITTPAEWPLVMTGRAAALSGATGDLDAAVRAGAFDGLRRAVRDLGATGTIATIASSGLRGRRSSPEGRHSSAGESPVPGSGATASTGHRRRGRDSSFPWCPHAQR